MSRIARKNLEDAGALIHVATQIFFYRSPDARAFEGCVGPFQKFEWEQGQLLYFDAESLARAEHPLRYHIIVTCIAPKSIRWRQFHKNGHTRGWGRTQEADWKQVICFLAGDFRSFPRNFVPDCADSEPSGVTEQTIERSNP